MQGQSILNRTCFGRYISSKGKLFETCVTVCSSYMIRLFSTMVFNYSHIKEICYQLSFTLRVLTVIAVR